MDGKHQQCDAAFERLQVDIQHLDLGGCGLLVAVAFFRSDL